MDIILRYSEEAIYNLGDSSFGFSAASGFPTYTIPQATTGAELFGNVDFDRKCGQCGARSSIL